MKEKILDITNFFKKNVEVEQESTLNEKIVKMEDLFIQRDKKEISKYYIQGKYIIEERED
ncbi:MAG: hypothetical protein WC895_01120 [Candidatus Shapirobacteria bacterium]|jgi:hypothetical protein